MKKFIFIGLLLIFLAACSEIPVTGTVYSLTQESKLRDYGNLQELKDWLAADDTNTNVLLVANKEGVISLKDICEDYALQLQNRAIADGYKMSFYLMYPTEYYQHFGKPLTRGTLHAVNLVIIENDVFLIEPQTDEVWLVARLD